MKWQLHTNSPSEFYEIARYLRSPLQMTETKDHLYIIANYGILELKLFCLNSKIIGFEKTAYIALEPSEKQEAFIRWFWKHATINSKGKAVVSKTAKMIDAYCAEHGIY